MKNEFPYCICYCFLLNMFACLSLHAQPGFNNFYNIDQRTTTFLNITNKSDTSFVLYSLRRDLSSPIYLQGIRLIEMDTLGNILDTSVYYDPNGRHMLLNSNYGFTTEPDGSFVGLGVFEDLDHSNFLIRFNPDLSFQSISEYSNAGSLFVDPKGLARKGETGYYLFGGKVITDSDYQGFIKFVGLDGTPGISRTYGNSANDEFIHGVFPMISNSALVGKVIIERFYGAGDPESYTSFMTINKLGNVVSEWVSPAYAEGGPFGVVRLDNGDLVYYTRKMALDTWEAQDFRIMQVCRDSNFQLKWETTMSAHPGIYNGGNGSFKGAPDGGWYCSGIEPVKLDGINETWECYVYKLSADGDSIWKQYVELPSSIDVSKVPFHQLTGSLILPSGSLILTGYIDRVNDNGINIESGWLVKMSPDGCIEWSNCLSGSAEVVSEEGDGSPAIFPNPTTGILNMKFEQSTRVPLLGKITDLLGREIDTFEIPANSTDFMLDLSKYASGLYFWNLTNGKTQRMTGKIILNK